jgi:hypothetical protein
MRAEGQNCGNFITVSIQWHLDILTMLFWTSDGVLCRWM